MSGTTTRYSESFKLKVVNELESGRFACQTEARKFYNIKGSHTIRDWLTKYGRNHLLAKVVRVETLDERSRVKELENEIKKLKETVVDLSCREVISRATLNVICSEHGIDQEAAKKKVNVLSLQKVKD